MTTPKTLLLPFAALLLLGSAPPGRGDEWSTNPQSSVRLITPADGARSGEVDPGPALPPSRLARLLEEQRRTRASADRDLPAAALLGTPEILGPADRFDLPGGLVAFGYEARWSTPCGRGPAAAKLPKAPRMPRRQRIRPHHRRLDYCLPGRLRPLPLHAGARPAARRQAGGRSSDGDDPAIVGTSGCRDRPRDAGVQTGACSTPAARDARPEIRVLGATAAAARPISPGEPRDLRRRPAAMKPVAAAWSSTSHEAEGTNKALPAKTSIAWTVSNLTAKDGQPFSLEARRTSSVDRCRRRAAGSAAAGAGGRREAPRAFRGCCSGLPRRRADETSRRPRWPPRRRGPRAAGPRIGGRERARRR